MTCICVGYTSGFRNHRTQYLDTLHVPAQSGDVTQLTTYVDGSGRGVEPIIRAPLLRNANTEYIGVYILRYYLVTALVFS